MKNINLHWFCTQNHILSPFSVRRACTKSYVTSEPYPRASQIWCQNVRETRKKIVIKCRSESFARCRVIARNVEGGHYTPPPPVLLGLRSSICKHYLFRGWIRRSSPKQKNTLADTWSFTTTALPHCFEPATPGCDGTGWWSPRTSPRSVWMQKNTNDIH